MIEKEFVLKNYTIAGKVKIGLSKNLIQIKAIDKKTNEILQQKDFKPLFNPIDEYLTFLSKEESLFLRQWIQMHIKLY